MLKGNLKLGGRTSCDYFEDEEDWAQTMPKPLIQLGGKCAEDGPGQAKHVSGILGGGSTMQISRPACVTVPDLKL